MYRAANKNQPFDTRNFFEQNNLVPLMLPERIVVATLVLPVLSRAVRSSSSKSRRSIYGLHEVDEIRPIVLQKDTGDIGQLPRWVAELPPGSVTVIWPKAMNGLAERKAQSQSCHNGDRYAPKRRRARSQDSCPTTERPSKGPGSKSTSRKY